MIEIECYSIEVWDGGDRHNHKFYVKSEAEAKKWKEKNPHDYYHKKTFIVFDTLEEAEANDLATVRKNVIARLSTIERRALGITE